jgi:hypothetical protein
MGIQETSFIIARLQAPFNHTENLSPDRSSRQLFIFISLELLLESFIKSLFKNIKIDFETKLLPLIGSVGSFIISILFKATILVLSIFDCLLLGGAFSWGSIKFYVLLSHEGLPVLKEEFIEVNTAFMRTVDHE